MNITRLIVSLTLLCLGFSPFASAQAGANAEGFLDGLKTWKKIAAHKCTDANCKDFIKIPMMRNTTRTSGLPCQTIRSMTMIWPIIRCRDAGEKPMRCWHR